MVLLGSIHHWLLLIDWLHWLLLIDWLLHRLLLVDGRLLLVNWLLNFVGLGFCNATWHAVSSSLTMTVEVDTCDSERGNKEQEFKTTETGCGSHRVSVGVDICGSNTLWQEVKTTLLIAISVVIISAGIRAICDDLVGSDLGREKGERDNPENDGEDIETKDGPVVVHCRDGHGCNKVVDDNDHGCYGGEEGKIVTVKGNKCDAIRGEAQNCKRSDQLSNSEAKNHCGYLQDVFSGRQIGRAHV